MTCIKIEHGFLTTQLTGSSGSADGYDAFLQKEEQCCITHKKSAEPMVTASEPL